MSRYFQKWIIKIDELLFKRVVKWPERDIIRLSMPSCFRKNFPNVYFIIDCFEVQIQIPHSPTDQASSYSSYKARNTAKILISCTPQAHIHFVSPVFVGRESDQHITLHSGFLDGLQEGDQVMADKGFTVESVLLLKGAKLVTPAFKKAKQLSHKETEDRRDVSNVRIHVERLIGSLRLRFNILRGPVAMPFLRRIDDANTFFDKIVHVCCILHNFFPSVVPLD